MNLFAPRNANAFVFAIVDGKSREGTKPDYSCVPGDSIDECLEYLLRSGKRSVHDYPMGRYDDQGRYCTYKSPLENVDRLMHGRFCIHPLAKQEYEVHKRELTYG